jgi:tRNA(Ile)-lysidine synthase
VDRDALQFPLTLRRWRQGDHFRPLGMAGTKKVGKYFKDEKFALSDKRNAWLLCSANDIVWIVGHRADERFKVTPNTKHILRISTS